VAEAQLARDVGYEVALLSLGSLKNESIAQLLEHSRTIASIIPVMGFYLQPAVGGRSLPYEFWRHFVEIENVVAIKIAPFNRYRTIDVVRAVAESGRAHEIALYTGNDDNILNDLLMPFDLGGKRMRIVGGLLGHWAIWTKTAVAQLQTVKAAPNDSFDILALGARMTDANAAVFDAANQFRGCIPGIHEILRRQGLLAGRWCLDESEDLSPGQLGEIDRVCRSYPDLQDDTFVKEHLDEWLR
jgi:dihydrodipicolinate synthase/N-acetylneuraminate lyase